MAAAVGSTRHAPTGRGDRRPPGHRSSGARHQCLADRLRPGQWGARDAGRPAPVHGGALPQPGGAELPDAPLRRARPHPDRARRERQGRQRLQPAQGVRLHLHWWACWAERLARALFDFDAEAGIREVGLPELDHESAGGPDSGR